MEHNGGITDDDVAEGERDWKNVLDEFYGDFKKKLEVAAAPDGGMRANQPVMTDIPCKECGRPMQIRTASTGVFLGCSGYSLPPKERCKATVNLVPGDEIAPIITPIGLDPTHPFPLLVNKSLNYRRA